MFQHMSRPFSFAQSSEAPIPVHIEFPILLHHRFAEAIVERLSDMTAQITDEERRELKVSFDLFDDSKTGTPRFIPTGLNLDV